MSVGERERESCRRTSSFPVILPSFSPNTLHLGVAVVIGIVVLFVGLPRAAGRMRGVMRSCFGHAMKACLVFIR